MKSFAGLLLFASLAAAQTLTTVSDTIFAPDGSAIGVNGTIHVELTGFCTQGTNTIRPAPILVTVRNGILLTAAGATGQPLIPSDSCSEGTTLYQVRYDVRGPGGPIKQNITLYWNVPTSGTAVTIDAIETENAGTPPVGSLTDADIPNLNTLSTGLTALRAVITDGSAFLASSAVTSTELGHVSGVTSAIQTQLNAKLASSFAVNAGAIPRVASAGVLAEGSLTDNADGIVTLADADGPNQVKVTAGSAQGTTDYLQILASDGTTRLSTHASNGGLYTYTSDVPRLALYQNILALSTLGVEQWHNNANVELGTVDVERGRLNAGALYQRASTISQSYCLYGTYTDDTNYERTCITESNGFGLLLSTGTAGTGADNLNIRLTPSGTGYIDGGVSTWKGGQFEATSSDLTAVVRYATDNTSAFISVDSSNDYLRFLLSPGGANGEKARIAADGTFAIGTTDLDGTPAIGRLIVQATTNDGSTYAQVWRDSDGVNIASIDSNGVLTVSGGGGGGAWDTLTAPSSAVSMISDQTTETVTFDFQSAFTTGSQYIIKSSLGNPSGGVLVEILGHDANVVPFKATGDGSAGVQLSAAGALTAIGTGSITAGLLTGNVTGGTSIAFGADPADAGALRGSNNAVLLAAEIATPGADMTLTPNASDQWAFSHDVTVPDEAYGVGWNGSTEAPTKNAIYDKIETLAGGGIYSADFTNQTTLSIPGATHNLGTNCNWAPMVFTVSGSVRTAFDPGEYTCDFSTGAVSFSFAASTSGRVVLTLGGSAGGAGDVTAASAFGTDNSVIRADGTGKGVQASLITISDTGVLGLPDGVRQTFNPDATLPGLNVGSQAGDPSTPTDGDVWYNSSTLKFRCRENGSTVNCIGAGGSGDSIEIEDGDNGNTFTAIDTTARFDDSGEINFAFTDGGAGGPDIVTATVRANLVGVSRLASSTSADLAGVLSDETGSGGGFMRATEPTVTGLVLGNLAEATCDSSIRGKITLVQGGAGVADTVRICTKDSGDAYAWRPLL